MTGPLILTDEQAHVLNDAGQALIDLGLNLSVSFSPSQTLGGKPYLLFTARDCFTELNEKIANPPPKELKRPSEVVEAIKSFVDDVAGGETSISTSYLREHLDELKVKD